MMKGLGRQLRELMIPRRDALLLAQADAARDARDWEAGAGLYREFVALHPDRNGLLMQSGHCLKEMGRCRTALADYRAVTTADDRPEADFHVGELLKLTGNPAAASWAYRRSAACGHTLAAQELDRLARGETVLHLHLYDRAVETGGDEGRILGRLFALELAPFDWRRLAAAAEDTAVYGFAAEANLLADLALIVGGPVAGRQQPYRTIFGDGAIWGERYAVTLGSPVFAPVQPSEALARWLDNFEFRPTAAAQERGAANDEDGTLCLVGDDETAEDASFKLVSASVASLRECLYGEGGPALIEAIVAFAACLPANGRPVFATLPEDGRHSLAAAFRRVSLNVAALVADRLAAPLRTAPAASVAAGFAVATARATLSTAAAGDTVPAVIAVEEDGDPATRQKLSELLAIGLVPDGSQDGTARLLALADQGRQAPLAHWFAVSAPTIPPSRIGEVAVRLAHALRRRGAHAEALVWAERAAAAAPEQYTMDLGVQRKVCGDFAGAVKAFNWVLAHEPDHEAAARELDAVVRECLGQDEIAALLREHPGFAVIHGAAEKEAREARGRAEARASHGGRKTLLDIADLRDTRDFGPERLEWQQIGWLRSEVDGVSFPRLVGVVAIRLCHVGRDAPLRLRIRVDGRTVDLVEPSLSGVDGNGVGRHVFNSWIDTRALPRGPARLQAYVELKSAGYRTLDETVIIDDLRPGEDYPSSDAFVAVPGDGGPEAGLVERVLALPATARPAQRTAFDHPVERVLVMRLDQLGDLSASMPAIRRLKEVFPQARFEGLVTPVNAYLLRASGLFDEVFTVDFTYDHGTRRRWLGRGAHAEIERRYGGAPVDVAIDLSPGDDSRPVLMLINARYRAGFKPHRFGFLDFGIDLVTRDPVNRKEAVSHTAMIGAFVEALATMFRPPPPRFPVDPALMRHLAPFGLGPQGYIAIHVGSRLAIKRWPLQHYVALAGLLRVETGQEIVLFSDDPVPQAQMAALDAIGGIRVLAGRTEFEVFDALIAHAAVFIGNDTGPKHLASLRGVRTVSVHMDQVNWNEWGQDGEGLIVSKRVPCCGCGIEDPSECGKAMACLDGLSPREVADAVVRVMG